MPHNLYRRQCFANYAQSRKTNPVHRLCHRPKWAPLGQDLPPPISMAVAFAVHLSANKTGGIKAWQSTLLKCINGTLFLCHIPLCCQNKRWKPAWTGQSLMTCEKCLVQHTVWHLLYSICCWWSKGTRPLVPLASLARATSLHWGFLRQNQISYSTRTKTFSYSSHPALTVTAQAIGIALTYQIAYISARRK